MPSEKQNFAKYACTQSAQARRVRTRAYRVRVDRLSPRQSACNAVWEIARHAYLTPQHLVTDDETRSRVQKAFARPRSRTSHEK